MVAVAVIVLQADELFVQDHEDIASHWHEDKEIALERIDEILLKVYNKWNCCLK